MRLASGRGRTPPWTSMERTTRSGHLLGPDQRIDTHRGQSALTINPTWNIAGRPGAAPLRPAARTGVKDV
jgi:hypothetical protein